jgi:hypothetical protein
MAAPAAGPTRPDPGPATGAGTPPPGFLLERGRFKPVALPRGLEDLTLRGIAPIDLNDRRQIVGTYEEPIGGAVRGFLLDKRGRFTKINPPGAKGTQPQGINNRGQIVGTGVTGTTGSGFLRDARGRLTAINRPGKSITIAFDINNRGQIVGIAVNPEDPASSPPTDSAPMGRMT